MVFDAKVLALTAVLFLAIAQSGTTAGADKPPMKISAIPMHAGRVSPMLFGNFMELLDDLIPGMWAEMLNDRSFEGITKRAEWCYYEGEPNICDRRWEGDGWTYDAANPFNGARSIKLTGKSSSLTQPGLYVQKGKPCEFLGYLRADDPNTGVEVLLKAQIPDGKWMTLASARFTKLSKDWKRYSASLTPSGTTDRAVFEVRSLGGGSVWADKLSLMPADNVSGWRKDVVQAIKESKPAIIRWGGSVCDPGGYRWKEGIGDRDRRVPFANKVWGRIDSNDVGLDEFLRFCELTKAEPLICLSFSDGPQSAADLVQYCNGSISTEWGAKRAANGHPKPYNVKYWQLGNELGNPDYVNGLPEFCKAMKTVDPGAVLMASFPSQLMLDKVGRDIAYIGPHHYTPDFPACEADFKNLSKMISDTPGCGHIRIAVTEWNITAGSFGLGRGKLMTLDSALQNARYLNLLMRYSNIVDIACRSNMTNSLGSGTIATNPSGLLKRPSYHVMKLYATHAKPVPLTSANVPEGLDVMACASGDRKSLCIFAVNSGTAPVEFSLDLSDFGTGMHPVGGEMVCDTLDEKQPDVMNHWSAPDRVTTIKLAPSADKVVLPALSVSAIEFGD